MLGLYSVLWGKHKEKQEEDQQRKMQELPEVVKDHSAEEKGTSNEDVEVNKLSAVVISMPMQEPPLKPNQMSKEWSVREGGFFLVFSFPHFSFPPFLISALTLAPFSCPWCFAFPIFGFSFGSLCGKRGS